MGWTIELLVSCCANLIDPVYIKSVYRSWRCEGLEGVAKIRLPEVT